MLNPVHKNNDVIILPIAKMFRVPNKSRRWGVGLDRGIEGWGGVMSV